MQHQRAFGRRRDSRARRKLACSRDVGIQDRPRLAAAVQAVVKRRKRIAAAAQERLWRRARADTLRCGRAARRRPAHSSFGPQHQASRSRPLRSRARSDRRWAEAGVGEAAAFVGLVASTATISPWRSKIGLERTNARAPRPTSAASARAGSPGCARSRPTAADRCCETGGTRSRLDHDTMAAGIVALMSVARSR